MTDKRMMDRLTKEDASQRRREVQAKKRADLQRMIDKARQREWDSMTEEEQVLRRKNQDILERLTETYARAREVRKAAAEEVAQLLHIRNCLNEERRPISMRLTELAYERERQRDL